MGSVYNNIFAKIFSPQYCLYINWVVKVFVWLYDVFSEVHFSELLNLPMLLLLCNFVFLLVDLWNIRDLRNEKPLSLSLLKYYLFLFYICFPNYYILMEKETLSVWNKCFSICINACLKKQCRREMCIYINMCVTYITKVCVCKGNAPILIIRGLYTICNRWMTNYTKLTTKGKFDWGNDLD